LKTYSFNLIGFVAMVAALVFTNSAEAGSFVSRTKYMNANMWSRIDNDTGMSWSVWNNKTRTVERHGGQPIVREYESTGYCFFVTTCPPAGGTCVTEKEICGDLTTGDIFAKGDTIRLIKDGFAFDCSVDRRANSSSSRRNVNFDGSSEESSAKLRSTEGRGTLSGVEGPFLGYCYSNEGTTRQKTVD
jgi:hypothetical protein